MRQRCFCVDYSGNWLMEKGLQKMTRKFSRNQERRASGARPGSRGKTLWRRLRTRWNSRRIQNKSPLEISKTIHFSRRIPAEFSGFRIAQVSDLHNNLFGDANESLLTELKNTRPDCIVLTGDLVDSRNPNMAVSLDFAGKSAAIAPVYYVPGNHEARMKKTYPELVNGLKARGVQVLHNRKTEISRGKAGIFLIGLADPGFRAGIHVHTVKQMLSKLTSPKDPYEILLVHRPELFQTYAKFPIDLVFSGHAHGGQIRIPGIGGVYVPSQGFFPQYDAGQFSKNYTTMFISRGLGNMSLIPRIHNPPELLVVELRHK